MTQQLYIKNMVCERCKQSVASLFKALGITVHNLNLGEVLIDKVDEETYAVLKVKLASSGFELIKSETEIVVEHVKVALIKTLEAPEKTSLKTSSIITNYVAKDYSMVSKLFSRVMGVTIEKYFIQLKIEKVKELLQLNQLQFTEIADLLGYTSSSHLARQFKSISGMSMSKFKALENWERKTLDKII